MGDPGGGGLQRTLCPHPNKPSTSKHPRTAPRAEHGLVVTTS